MTMDVAHSVFGDELPKETMRKTISVVCENKEKQLHEAREGEFTWHSDEPPTLGGDGNHPQPLTYLTAGIGQ
ncbi:MAG: hypothetical protein ACE5JS_19480 [Nitrospinota bacterium]